MVCSEEELVGKKRTGEDDRVVAESGGTAKQKISKDDLCRDNYLRCVGLR